jgi:hypothetical protein
MPNGQQFLRIGQLRQEERIAVVNVVPKYPQARSISVVKGCGMASGQHSKLALCVKKSGKRQKRPWIIKYVLGNCTIALEWIFKECFKSCLELPMEI